MCRSPCMRPTDGQPPGDTFPRKSYPSPRGYTTFRRSMHQRRDLSITAGWVVAALATAVSFALPTPMQATSARVEQARALFPIHVHSTGYWGDRTAVKGLNNQLWKVAGAIAAGCKLSPKRPNSYQAVILPRVAGDVPKVVGDKAAMKVQHQMGELFDIDELAAVFLLDHGCLVTDEQGYARMVEQGEVLTTSDYSKVRGGYIARQQEGLELDLLYKGLQLSARLTERYLQPCMERLVTEFGGQRDYLTIHMRVEDDWVESCYPPDKKIHGKKGKKKGKRRMLRAFNPFPCLYNAKMIAAAAQATPETAQHKHIFMIYAQDRMNSKAIVKAYGHQPDPMAVWPPGVVLTNPHRLQCFNSTASTYTERSVVNLMLAAASPGPFMGTPKSSFSLGTILIRQHRTSAPSFMYGCASVHYQKAVQVLNHPPSTLTTHPC